MSAEQSSPADLAGATAGAHRHVADALRDPERDGAIAVAWASAHLAAVDRVLYRAARAAPDARALLRSARLADHHLQHAVFRLDRRLTGDTHLEGTPVERVAAEVRERLEVHARVESRVVQALERALSPAARDKLAARLAAATGTGPTRAHPYTPHTLASPVVAWVDAAVDRVRDVLDNRVSSTGRPVRPPRPLGRWGSYLMGTRYPSAPEEEP